jgi:hypothetical protein
MPGRDTRPYWMTRLPPLNFVGVTLASSAPCVVSKTSFARFRPRWTNEAPTRVRTAVTASKEPCAAAMRIPSPTGTAVADRNGSRVARTMSQPRLRCGLTGLPRSAESASK